MGLVETLHEERKARLARIKKAAVPETPEPPRALLAPVLVEAGFVPEPPDFVNKGSGSFEIILLEICEYYRCRQQDILSSRRLNSIAEKRQVFIYLMYLMTKMTNPQIGKKVNRDPTSVGYAIHKIRNNMERYKSDIEKLELRINAVFILRGMK